MSKLDPLLFKDRMHAPDFRWIRRVRWIDVDHTGTVHFANYVRFMEETEYAFLKSLGLNVVLEDSRGTIGFPRTSTKIEILNPAKYSDEVTTWIKIIENDGVAMAYAFEITAKNHQLVARGQFRVACCRFANGGLPKAILIPDFVLDRIPLIDKKRN